LVSVESFTLILVNWTNCCNVAASNNDRQFIFAEDCEVRRQASVADDWFEKTAG